MTNHDPIVEELAALQRQAPADLIDSVLQGVDLADSYTEIAGPTGRAFVAWNGRGSHSATAETFRTCSPIALHAIVPWGCWRSHPPAFASRLGPCSSPTPSWRTSWLKPEKAHWPDRATQCA